MKNIIFNPKLLLKNLLIKFRLIIPTNEKAAPIDAGVWDRYYVLSILISKVIKNIPSDEIKDLIIVEAGIGNGNTFLFLTLIAQKLNLEIFGYDSFSGFPEIKTSKDRRIGARLLKKGQWNVSSIDSIKRKLNYCGVNSKFINKKVTLIKGYFDETLTNFDKKKRIFFLHLDVDLYSSYKTCLERLWEHLIIGGIVVFDEYHDKAWPDAKDAIDKFFKSKGIKVEIEELTKRGYVIKK